jgi:hypothetical protein
LRSLRDVDFATTIDNQRFDVAGNRHKETYLAWKDCAHSITANAIRRVAKVDTCSVRVSCADNRELRTIHRLFNFVVQNISQRGQPCQFVIAIEVDRLLL